MGFKRMVSLSMAAAMSVPICCANSGYQKSAADETQDMVTLLECGFENGTEGWTGRGAASAAADTSGGHTGTSSLKVTKRITDWNGAVITLGSEFRAGTSYSAGAWVKYDTGGSTEKFKLSLQYTDSGGTVRYDAVDEESVTSGKWTLLSNENYTIPAGASDIYLYVETVDSTIDFWVDDVTVKGPEIKKQVPVKNISGDMDSDGMIDPFDLTLLRQAACKTGPDQTTLKRGDINGDKIIDKEDICLLSGFILGDITEFPQIEEEYERTYDFKPVGQLTKVSEVPDPFIFNDGTAVSDASDWGRRANEISCMYEYYMYGIWRDGSDDEVTYSIKGSTMTINIKRKSTGQTASFPAKITLPGKVRHDGGAPVIVGMHKQISEETAKSLGYAVITIDADIFTNPVATDDQNHVGAFYKLYPYGNSWEEQTGELLAWSWGCSKILDALYAGAGQELNINPDSSIVTGVSRYGKAAAVCGAYDKRFKMVAPSCSGAGGLALYRYRSVGKTYDFSSKGESSAYTYSENEHLGSLQSTGERGWFNDRFREFSDPNQIPLDQHMLGSLVADPDRYLFMIASCVNEDWVNAPSMWVSYLGIKHVYDFLGISDNLAINVHSKGHAVIEEDVRYMVQYFDYHVYGIEPSMDLSKLKTSVFALPKNHDTFFDTFDDKWLY